MRRSNSELGGRAPHSISVLVVGCLLTGCAGEPKRVAPLEAVPARVFAAAYESVAEVIDAPGTVHSRDTVVLSSQINGNVREVRVRAGDVVRAGQVLAVLDARDSESQRDAARAAIVEAEAALAEARMHADAAASMRSAARAAADLTRATFHRYEKLFEDRSLSPQELDEARARRDSAEAELAARELMLTAAQKKLSQIEARIAQANAQARRADVLVSWTLIKAPSAGRIVERRVDPGSAVFPGSQLLVLEAGTNPQVLAEISAVQSGLLGRGLEVRVRSGDRQIPGIRGRISEIIPRSDTATHSVRFKVDLPTDSAVASGQFVRVEIPAGKRPALLVPRESVRESGQLTGVFVADPSSIARFRLVKVSTYDARRVEVLAGVDPGERIIEQPGERILDGTPLEIRP